MKVKVTLQRSEVLTAIGKHLVELGVPLIAGTFQIRMTPHANHAWVDLTETGKLEAIVEYECEALSSAAGAVDTGSRP